MCGCKAASLTSKRVRSNNCIKGRAPRGPFFKCTETSRSTARQGRDLLLLSGRVATATLQGPSVAQMAHHPATSLPSRQHQGSSLQNSPAGQPALPKNSSLCRGSGMISILPPQSAPRVPFAAMPLCLAHAWAQTRAFRWHSRPYPAAHRLRSLGHCPVTWEKQRRTKRVEQRTYAASPHTSPLYGNRAVP